MLPDVILIRGAPGVGKSATAKEIAVRLGRGARVEVDSLRAMITGVSWTDQRTHIAVLSLAADVAAHFLRLGCCPVVVVYTFSGDKIERFLQEVRHAAPDATIRIVSLVPTWAALKDRLERRPTDGYRDLSICERLNSEMALTLLPGELLIDNSERTAEACADLILGEEAGG